LPARSAGALPSPVRMRIRSRSNSASPSRTVSISRPCRCCGVDPCMARDRTPAFLLVISASVFNRSRVDRANRSRRVTTSTSPVPSVVSALRSCPRFGRRRRRLSAKLAANFLAPASHRLVGDSDTALCQDQLNVAQAEAEDVIQPDGVADDLGREPMAVVGSGGGVIPPV
jgi:hypothetical protein